MQQENTLGENKQKRAKRGHYARLTPEQIEFVQYVGIFTQKFTAPKLAKIFGVSAQAVNLHIIKKKREDIK